MTVLMKGRIPELDPVSREPRYAAALVDTPVTRRWEHKGPVLNQNIRGIGGCTGYAAMTFLNSEFAQRILFGDERHWFTDEDADLAYHYATRRDGFPGVWLPDDTGSSGLAVCKALQKDFRVRGRLVATGYVHAFGAKGLARRMKLSPAMIGIPWMTSMDYPDASGYLRHEPGTEDVTQWHEIYTGGYIAEEQYFVVLNTWGDDWGGVGLEENNPGCARIDYALMDWLLRQQGDVIVPTLRMLQ